MTQKDLLLAPVLPPFDRPARIVDFDSGRSDRCSSQQNLGEESTKRFLQRPVQRNEINATRVTAAPADESNVSRSSPDAVDFPDVELRSMYEVSSPRVTAPPLLKAADPLAAWTCYNETPGRPLLIWQWTQRGFGSELLVMLLAMLHAIEEGRSFCLASRRSNLAVRQGWTDWFEPFCPATDSLALWRGKLPKAGGVFARWLSHAARVGWVWPRNTTLAHDVFQKIWNENQNQRHFSIAPLAIDGNLMHACSVCLKMVWRLQPGILAEIANLLGPLELDAGPYAALHMRAGDKYKEVRPVAIESYLETLERERPELKTVFVATDDYSAFARLRDLRPDLDWRTLATPKRSGHLQRRFNRRPLADRRRATLELLAELEVLRRCHFFVGTASSNIGRLTSLFIGSEACDFVDGWRSWFAVPNL